MRRKETKHSNEQKDELIGSEEYLMLPEDEREKWTPVKDKYEKVPLWCKISLIVALLSVILYVIICFSPPFADFFNKYISGFFRFIFAQISNFLPFSIAEAALILIPVFLVLIIRYVWKYRCNTRKSTLVTLVCIFSVASVFLSSFIITFSAGYRGTKLEEKLGLEATELDKDDLYNASVYLIEEINKLEPMIEFGEDGFSIMPYTFSEMNNKLIDAYESFSKEHGFINNFYSKLKPVLMSEAMSYAHITGVYTFFTGESNINVGFPDYTIPYTAAHELAHQRGIAREDEANMMAFLVSVESDDIYIRYCAYVNMYEYVANALYKADRTLYRKADAMLSRKVYGEQVAYSKFFKKYVKSVTSQISGAVNDAYLQSQGTAGRKSYGMVVDLTVAYLKSNSLIEK